MRGSAHRESVYNSIYSLSQSTEHLAVSLDTVRCRAVGSRARINRYWYWLVANPSESSKRLSRT